MRRIALLLTAAMLTLVGTSAAQAQDSEYGAVLDKPGVECIVTQAPTDTATGIVVCTGGGLKASTAYQVSINWQAKAAPAAASFSASAGAVAFVGAQGTLNTTITGTTNPNGNFSASGVVPVGADTDLPATATLTGTAADGTPAVAADVLNAQATDPGAPTTPATGAESGTLALIAAGALALGAGALVATRRRKTEMVA